MYNSEQRGHCIDCLLIQDTVLTYFNCDFAVLCNLKRLMLHVICNSSCRTRLLLQPPVKKKEVSLIHNRV